MDNPNPYQSHQNQVARNTIQHLIARQRIALGIPYVVEHLLIDDTHIVNGAYEAIKGFFT